MSHSTPTPTIPVTVGYANSGDEERRAWERALHQLFRAFEYAYGTPALIALLQKAQTKRQQTDDTE